MTANSTIDLSYASSDEDYVFTLQASAVTKAMGTTSVKMAAIDGELKQDRDFVFVEHDDGHEYKHFTREGIVKLGKIIDTKRAREFAKACEGFTPDW